jgi:hypothetical protein
MKTITKVGIWNRALERIGETGTVASEDEDRLAASVCKIHFDDVLEKVLESFQWPFATKQIGLTAFYSVYDSETTYSDGDKVQYNGLAYESLTDSNVGNSELSTDTTNWQSLGVLCNGWGYAYELPSDCITPLDLVAEGERFGQLSRDTKYPFEIRSYGQYTVLLTDLEPDDTWYLEYVCRPMTEVNADNPDASVYDNFALYPRQVLDVVIWYMAAELARSLKKDPQTGISCEQMADRCMLQAITAANNNRQPDIEPDSPSIAAREGYYYGNSSNIKA